MAVDAASGKVLWNFETKHNWKASPMTYMFDGTQYLAVAAGAERHRVRGALSAARLSTPATERQGRRARVTDERIG